MGKGTGGIRGRRNSVQAISLDEFLGKRGLKFPISDFLDDKLKQPHTRTAKAWERFRKEADIARNNYAAKRSAAIDEYNNLFKQGKIINPERIETLLKAAKGHSDNESVQAARRLLKKRYGITNW